MGHWSWGVAVDPLVLLAILFTVGGGVYELVKIGRRVDKGFGEFKDDWNGTPARPGVPRRPGVMERMETIELHQVDQGQLLSSQGKTLSDIGARLERNGL